jgi:hypothetical protein
MSNQIIIRVAIRASGARRRGGLTISGDADSSSKR